MPHALDEHDLNLRHDAVCARFPHAISMDDFISRMEIVLSTFGFTGENSIAMTNLCRDEVTSVLKDKIEAVFGSSFNTNGLGGVLTCGVSGVKAGLSHSPVCVMGRERYVFFSFPHIAIDSAGKVGSISRHNRAEESCACGGLQMCLDDFRQEGYMDHCREPGVHDPLDPEYTILKQRLARRLRYEKADVSALTLEHLTAVAERTITNDLEYLIERTVDHSKADYAVVTGIQIHNWAAQPNGAPSLEFVAPTKVFVVMNHKKTHLDLRKVPSLSPRQLQLLGGPTHHLLQNPSTTPEALLRQLAIPGVMTVVRPPHTPLHRAQARPSPRVTQMQATWQASFSTRTGTERDKLAPTMDSKQAPPPPIAHRSVPLISSSRHSAPPVAVVPTAFVGTSAPLPLTAPCAAEAEAQLLAQVEEERAAQQQEEEEEDDFNTSFLSRIHNWTGYARTSGGSVNTSIAKEPAGLSPMSTGRTLSTLSASSISPRQ